MKSAAPPARWRIFPGYRIDLRQSVFVPSCPRLSRASTSFFIARGRRGWPGRSPAMTKIEAAASCSALILRSREAASRRMAACTFVAILRDAPKERAPQDKVSLLCDGKEFQSSDLHVQPLFQKYFRSLLTQITCISLAVSLLRRGGSRSSRTRGGMRWTLMAPITNGA